MIIQDNKKLADSKRSEMSAAKRERIEDAARLGGITVDEAYERNGEFRYLY